MSSAGRSGSDGVQQLINGGTIMGQTTKIIGGAVAMLGVTTTAVSDAAAAKSNIIFACTTTSGKRAQFIDQGSGIAYSYGRLGAAPDKTFTVDRSAAAKNVPGCCANGHGPESYLKVQYQGLDYGAASVEWYQPPSKEASISVTDPRKSKPLADTKCASGIVNNIATANLRQDDEYYGAP
jgi:hypothetical protein